MKDKRKLIAIAVVAVIAIVVAVIFILNGKKKDTYDYQANLPGEYIVYHWFYDVKDGESGFYEDDKAGHYTFGADGSYSHTGGDLDEGITQTGTYTFTSSNVIRITLEDGSYDDMTLRYSTKHTSTEMTNNATKFSVSLQKE